MVQCREGGNPAVSRDTERSAVERAAVCEAQEVLLPETPLVASDTDTRLKCPVLSPRCLSRVSLPPVHQRFLSSVLSASPW
jgi:hypothetical protein